MHEQSSNISIIVLLMGRYECLVGEFAEMVEQLRALPDADIVFAIDGKSWAYSPLCQMLPYLITNSTVITLKEESSSPACLIESALLQTKHDFIVLTYPLAAPVTSRYRLFHEATENGANAVLTTYCIRNSKEVPPYIYANDGNIFGFCQNADIFHLDELCFPRDYLLKCSPLDKSPLLCEQFERWLSLMLFRGTEMVVAGSLERSSVPMFAYPFRNKRAYGDLAWRYALYSAAPTKPLHRDYIDVYTDFLKDISDEDLRRLDLHVPHDNSAPRYRILLIGGWWEYHHNQICFQNYFEHLQGTGFATFRTAFETTLQPSELDGYDLVIFTRCRSDESVKLMRYCGERGIRTLYMIDDNWFSFAKDFPHLGGIFIPGNPNYDNFICMLGLTDAVWLFNPYLEEDAKPYCKQTICFEISVLPSLYYCEAPRVRNDDTLYIGYAGSMRWSNSIFDALARVAREDNRVRIVLLGVISQEQLNLFNGLEVIYKPFTSYSRYTALMGELRPDLLLAPLIDSRTNRSKCYNKYIESGVVGAACIYTHTAPYTLVVEDGINGYFVESDDVGSWYIKLCEVLGNIPALRMVQNRAKDDVMAHHTVEAVIDEFRRKLCSVIQ